MGQDEIGLGLYEKKGNSRKQHRRINQELQLSEAGSNAAWGGENSSIRKGKSFIRLQSSLEETENKLKLQNWKL